MMLIFFFKLAQVVTCLACIWEWPTLAVGCETILTNLTDTFLHCKVFNKNVLQQICFSSKAPDGELFDSSLIGSVSGMLHLGLHGFWTLSIISYSEQNSQTGYVFILGKRCRENTCHLGLIARSILSCYLVGQSLKMTGQPGSWDKCAVLHLRIRQIQFMKLPVLDGIDTEGRPHNV